MAREPNGRFLPGTGGRQPGSRNKLQGKFIDALVKDFAENGEDTIRIVRVEKPAEYLKIIASVLPKEFLVTPGAVDEMTEEEINEALAKVRAARNSVGSQAEH